MEQLTNDINLQNASNYTDSNTSILQNSSDKPYLNLEYFLNVQVMTTICLVGILGNLLNILILTLNSIKSNMRTLEKNAYIGLLGLSLSDLLFCISVLPHAMHFEVKFIYANINFALPYTAYQNAIINTFVTSSSWLTVTMGIQRYLAICQPMKARQRINVTFARWSVVAVFGLSIVINLPRFWFHRIIQYCYNEEIVYYVHIGLLKQHRI